MNDDSTFGYGFVTLPRGAARGDDPFTFGMRCILGMRAAWGDWEERGVALKRGQVLLSRNLVASIAGWDRYRARRFLEKLENEGWLRRLRRVGDLGTVYEIPDYDKIFGIAAGRAGGGGGSLAGSAGVPPAQEAISSAEAMGGFASQAGGTPALPALPEPRTASFQPTPPVSGLPASDHPVSEYRAPIGELFRSVVQDRPLYPDELRLIDAWDANGLFLETIQGEIHSLAQRERSRGQSIGSLRYFDNAVRQAGAEESLRRQREELEAEEERAHIAWLRENGYLPSRETTDDERLENLVAWLERVPPKFEETWDVTPFCDEILALRGEDMATIYNTLPGIEDRLMAEVREHVRGQQLEELTKKFQEVRKPWFDEAVDKRLKHRLMRDYYEIPALSLTDEQALEGPPLDIGEEACDHENRDSANTADTDTANTDTADADTAAQSCGADPPFLRRTARSEGPGVFV